ncbi:rhodanese-like domain-containing protein [Dethiobacter alkaliphilus]|uniref:Rhodanese domain protein n=1 Tax=Dethiobacter alkaliphilus AHT 1 TaxID=555088 RepID=C0GHF9_DETAL|nr:rhodanese-like domain-containing protein [Dethiobacter alkaliphilus]EEG77165.1 Rhodanese domain protein [Dethiobacter alkaliphilus AHT 1]
MKKTFKLLLVLLLVGVMAFGLVGCGNEENNNNEPVDIEDNDNNLEEEIALDPQEVVLEAAKAYFPKVADDNNIISSEDVKEALESNPDAMFILDIRSAEDFEEGHIAGAVHSGWGNVGEIMDRLPKNRPVVVACYSGQTAGQAVALLRMAGFDNAQSMLYGMRLGWEEEGFAKEGTGMVAAADLSAVTSPADEKEEILWEKAQAVFADIADGNRALFDPEELQAGLEENPNAFYVLDIRRGEDFEEGYIEHSVHSPWAQVGELLESLPTNRPVVVGCYSGQTAGQTVGVLRMLGLDARSLLYGVRDGWVERAELPLVTE